MPCIMAALLAVFCSVRFDTQSDVEDMNEATTALEQWKAQAKRRAS